MRYCPSLVPDTATAAAIQIGIATTTTISNNQSNDNNTADTSIHRTTISSTVQKTTQDDEFMDHDTEEDHSSNILSSSSAASSSLSPSWTIHDLIQQALTICNTYIHTITQHIHKQIASTKPISFLGNSTDSSLLPLLSLTELPLQLRFLNPSVNVIKNYYVHIPPQLEPSLVSTGATNTFNSPPVHTSAASNMLAKIAAASAASQASLIPVTKSLKLSLLAHKHINDRSQLIQQCTLALAKLTIAQELASSTTEETKDDNNNSNSNGSVSTLTTGFDHSVHTMMTYLRGITPSSHSTNLSARNVNMKTSVSSTTQSTVVTSITASSSTLTAGKKRERSEDNDAYEEITSTKNDHGPPDSKRSTIATEDLSITASSSSSANTTTVSVETEQARIMREKLQKQITDSILLTPDQRKLTLAFLDKFNKPEHFPDKNIYQQYQQAKSATMDTGIESTVSPALTNLLRVSLPLEDKEINQNNKLINARTYIELNYETSKHRIYAKKL